MCSGWEEFQGGFFPCCDGLTLAGCHMTTSVALTPLPQLDMGRENKMKNLCVKVRTERDPTAITVRDKTDLGKLS